MSTSSSPASLSPPSSPTHSDSSPVGEAESHEWRPQQPGDVRSPCPALNTLANHGYLPRDGKQLTASVLIRGLEEGYGLSGPLANVLAIGGVALLGQLGTFGLNDLARHNRIEHDASLGHRDTKGRDEYAPLSPDSTLVKQFLDHANDGRLMTVEDVARARVLRESQCPALNNLHAEVARGEMAIALGLFSEPNSDRQGIPVDMLRNWFSQERLPDGWKPTHTQGLLETMRTSRQIFNEMKRIEEENGKASEERQKSP